jgi:hypothetical protein
MHKKRHSTEPNGALNPMLTQKPMLSPWSDLSAPTRRETDASKISAPSTCTATFFAPISARSHAKIVERDDGYTSTPRLA